MNVKELKELLKDLPDDMGIYLQRDPEGNGYSPMAGADPECIVLDGGDQVFSLGWSAYDCCLDEDEWEDIKQNNPRTLIIHPLY